MNSQQYYFQFKWTSKFKQFMKTVKFYGLKSKAIHGGLHLSLMSIQLIIPININTESYSLAIILSTYLIQQKASSRLGPSKLRKFLQFYSQCYRNSKKDKKLRHSIQKAEQRLHQNNQDVTIYQQIRNQIKIKGKKNILSDSQMSSEQKNQNFDSIELGMSLKNQVRSKKCVNIRKSQKQRSRINIQNFGQFAQIQNQKPINLSKMNNQSEYQVNISRQSYMKDNQSKKKQFKDPQEVKQSDNQEQPVKSSNGVITKQNSSNPYPIKKEEVKIPRRKGRPPKSFNDNKDFSFQLLIKQNQSKQGQNEEQNQIQIPIKVQRDHTQRINRRRLLMNKRIPMCPSTNQIDNLQSLTQEEVQNLKNSMKNQKQLAKVLLKMQIHIQNIKQILDLGVSLALQEGPLDKQSHILLQVLKATLLHKYFPEDKMYKKNFIKLTQQKKIVAIQSHYFIQEEVHHVQMKEEQQVFVKHDQIPIQKSPVKNIKKLKSKQKSVEYEPEKLKQIRAKATSKIEKIIRKSGITQEVKELAIQLENTFQQIANKKGLLYRNVAYERLRNMKSILEEFREKKIDEGQIKKYLVQLLEQYQSESIKGTHSVN